MYFGAVCIDPKNWYTPAFFFFPGPNLVEVVVYSKGIRMMAPSCLNLSWPSTNILHPMRNSQLPYNVNQTSLWDMYFYDCSYMYICMYICIYPSISYTHVQKLTSAIFVHSSDVPSVLIEKQLKRGRGGVCIVFPCENG